MIKMIFSKWFVRRLYDLLMLETDILLREIAFSRRFVDKGEDVLADVVTISRRKVDVIDFQTAIIRRSPRKPLPKPSFSYLFYPWSFSLMSVPTLPDQYRALNKTDVITIRRNNDSDFNPEPTTIPKVDIIVYLCDFIGI